MERPVRIMLASLGTFFIALFAVWFVMNLSIGWTNSLAPNDPVLDIYARTSRQASHLTNR
jgi:hypothetical protein